MRFYWFALGALAVWRIAHLLNAEDGPWDLLTRLRRAAGTGFWGSLLDCFYCLTLWIALPFGYFLSERWKERILLWLALSGAASLLQQATWRHEHVSALYAEGEVDTNVLRQEQDSI
jgi:Protein of unknown function (DUF1360)